MMNAERTSSAKLHSIVPSRAAVSSDLESSLHAAADIGFEGINEEADAVVIGIVQAIIMRDGFRYAEVEVTDVISGAPASRVTVVAYARHTADTSADLGVGQRGLFFLVRHRDTYAVLGSGTGFMRFVGA